MEVLPWLLLPLLGAWAALDATSVGQVMVSRPLVTGTLTGLALGDPVVGFYLGFALEVIHLGAVPAGATWIPDPGPASIGGAVLAVTLGGGIGTILGTSFGVALSMIGGVTVVSQRRLNGRLVQNLEEGAFSPAALQRCVRVALLTDALRGGLLTLLGVVLALALSAPLARWWPIGDMGSWVVLLVCLALPLGIVSRVASPARGRVVLLAVGGLAGFVAGWWLLP